jgi:hypothetical protein
MRISPLRMVIVALLFASLSACIAKQPPLQGTWSDFSNENAKVTKEMPKEAE